MIDHDGVAILASTVVAYLLGSLPFAYIVAKTSGVDIFDVGTGNPGAANTFRKVGRIHGALVFALDIGKGCAAIYAAIGLGTPREYLPLIAAFVVLGHLLPVFLRFRGGAGLAAGVGAGLGLLGGWAWLGTVVGIVALGIVRDSPRAAGVVLAVAIATALLTGPDWMLLVGIAVICVLLAAKHLAKERATKRSVGLNGNQTAST